MRIAYTIKTVRENCSHLRRGGHVESYLECRRHWNGPANRFCARRLVILPNYCQARKKESWDITDAFGERKAMS